jgi:hypothetical protein
MSDTTLNRFLASGTTAERTAFVPDPPTPASGPDPGYLFWDTDLSALYTWDGGAWVAAGGGGGAAPPYVVGVTVDGGGSVVTTGVKGYMAAKQTGTITAWTVMADQAGDVEFDVTLDTPGVTYPPTTSIVAAAPPALSAADYGTDNTLSGWTTAVTAGQVFGFEVTGTPDAIELVTLILVVQP